MTELDHVALEVVDFDARVATFERLGFTLRRVGSLTADPSRRIAMLRTEGGAAVELIEADHDGFAHIAMRVGDVKSAQSDLIGAGMSEKRPVGRLEAARADSGMVTESGGLTIQLIRYDHDSPDA